MRADIEILLREEYEHKW